MKLSYKKLWVKLVEQDRKTEFAKKANQIDSDRYEALMQEAVADVGVKEATLKQATRDWERTKVLFEQDAVSQKERDAALSAYESAGASLKASQAALKSHH